VASSSSLTVPWSSEELLLPLPLWSSLPLGIGDELVPTPSTIAPPSLPPLLEGLLLLSSLGIIFGAAVVAAVSLSGSAAEEEVGDLPIEAAG
jgi:hypothetical protein